PHRAGPAALVVGAQPGWSAAQVRSAIVNTADENELLTFNGNNLESDVNIIGAGRDDAAKAVNARVALDPVSVSFGSVPSGSGQSRTATIALSTLAGAATSVTVTNQTRNGVSFSARLSGSTITVTMSATPRAGRGDCQ